MTATASHGTADRIHDVIVIGAGVAGWTAARRSQQLGVSVLVLEKSDSGPGYSNSLLSSAMVHAAYLDPRRSDPEAIYAQMMKKSDGHSRPDITRAWALNTGRAIDFLVSEGADFAVVGKPRFMQTQLQPSPVPTPAARDYWRDRGPHVFLTKMWQSFLREGGTFRPGVRAVELSTDEAVVNGVWVEPAKGGPRELVRGRAVIMADGGFQGNPELVAKYITPRKSRYRLVGSPNDTGDCLQMAMAIGAKVVEMDAFYGNVSLRDGLTNERLQHKRGPAPTLLVRGAMVANGNGVRIGDEALGPDEWSAIDPSLCTPILHTDAPGDSWVVFDDEIWETVGRGQDPDSASPQTANPNAALNPYLVEVGGTLLTAGSIEELAAGAGMPPAELRKTVDAFNRYCTDGTPLDPPRTRHPRPITRAPFHAIPLITGIIFTIGGVLVNGRYEALDERERPIPGLYAVGGTSGGLGGGPHMGYAGGWSEASTSALLAAESAVSRVRSPEAAAAR